MLVLFTIITFIYTALIIAFIIGYSKVELFKSTSEVSKTNFSIVIPFRNEAENLDALLQSISELEYPKNLFEVILVDDESDDESVSIIKNYNTKKPLDAAYIDRSRNTQSNITIINNDRLSNSPKKDAITKAIKQAKNDWIVTTDADCLVPKQWLQNFDACIQENNSKMIVAPVNYKTNSSFLDGFQTLDFWSLQAVTIGAFGIGKPFMNNGANLAYRKEVFFKLDGFEGNNNIASGDDLFIMEKLLQVEPESVHYLKSKTSIVVTKPQPSWKELCYQRLRWAAKSSAYKTTFPKITGFIVLLMNASLLVMLTLFLINEFNGFYLLILFLLKFVVDYLAIYKSALFFDENKLLKHYILSSFLYPFFSVSIGIYSMFFKYKWKGRAFRQ